MMKAPNAMLDAFSLLHHLLDVPDEGSRALLFGGNIYIAERVEKYGDLLILHNCEYRTVHSWPCVGAVVWLPIKGTTTLGETPAGEATNTMVIKHLVDTVGQRLIV